MKRYAILVFLFVILASCVKQPNVPPIQEDILYQVEGFYSQKHDSALQILDTLSVDVLSEKERAHYCLLKVKLRDHYFLYDSITDSLLQVAENYFVGGKDKWFEFETCKALSRIAFKEGKGDQVHLDWLLKAHQSIEQCQSVDERLIRYSDKQITESEMINTKKYDLLFQLGMTYINYGYVKEALRYLKEAEQYFAESQDSYMYFAVTNALGNAYLTLKEYDSCRMYYEKGMQAAEEADDGERIAYCHFSMSMFYRYQFDNQDYANEEEGKRILREAITECHRGLALYEGPMFRYKDGLYSELSKCFFLLEQYDSCAYYAEKQLEFMDAMHFEMVPNSANAAILSRLYKSHDALGHQEKALEYANRYFEMQQVISNQSKAVEQVKNEYEKQIEMMQLQHEQQTKRYRLYLLLALLLAALVVLLWLTNRYRKNKELEELKQKDAYRELQAEFEAVSRQVKQAQNALQQRVMDLYKTGEGNKLERILAEFEAVYPQGMEKLTSNYPNLTETERHIIVLSFLQFRVKEVAELLNLSTNTVVKYRTNIRKKVDSKVISDLIR